MARKPAFDLSIKPDDGKVIWLSRKVSEAICAAMRPHFLAALEESRRNFTCVRSCHCCPHRRLTI
jgi:hypothetical protein